MLKLLSFFMLGIILSACNRTTTASLAAAQANASCDPGKTCQNGSCQNQIASNCKTNDICPVNQTCQSGICQNQSITSCGTDDVCGERGTCLKGNCRCGLSPFCFGNSDNCTLSGVCQCGTAPACVITSDTCTESVCMCGNNAACQPGSLCLAGECSPNRHVFVTSNQYTPGSPFNIRHSKYTFSTASDGNKICQAEAKLKNLGNNWAAVLADESTSIWDNLQKVSKNTQYSDIRSVYLLDDETKISGPVTNPAVQGNFSSGTGFLNVPAGFYWTGMTNNFFQQTSTNYLCNNLNRNHSGMAGGTTCSGPLSGCSKKCDSAQSLLCIETLSFCGSLICPANSTCIGNSACSCQSNADCSTAAGGNVCAPSGRPGVNICVHSQCSNTTSLPDGCSCNSNIGEVCSNTCTSGICCSSTLNSSGDCCSAVPTPSSCPQATCGILNVVCNATAGSTCGPNGACTCVNNTDCPSDFCCTGGSCSPGIFGQQCPAVCISGAGNCPSGYYCNNGICSQS